MKATGIIRKVDELGRIVVPIELRNKLNINVRDEVEIYVENNSIILKKFEPDCIFCGNTSSLINFKEKLICQNCLKHLSNIENKKDFNC